MKMHLSESFRFGARHVFPPIIIGGLVSFFVFSLIKLTFKEFTLIYWIMSFVAYLLNYKAKKWTDYVVKNYGLHMEKNPVMRKMYAEKSFKDYYIGLLGMYVILLILYIIGACSREFIPFPKFFLIFPSVFLSVVIYDFLNDLLHLRKLKRKSMPSKDLKG